MYPNASPPEVLEQTFQERFSLTSPEDNFDKTLFHYLLTRLGAAKSRIAVEYSLERELHTELDTAAAYRFGGRCGSLRSATSKIAAASWRGSSGIGRSGGRGLRSGGRGLRSGIIPS